ncbi:MAG: hypothetical protein CMM25_08850 [Rhodospirillaceae bacterium]|nr:hypothetical protein [Rhodospirillaceae bacterium]
MSQSDYGTIDPATKSGTALASDLNSARDAWNSTHKGSSEPSYVRLGQLWIDDASDPNWELKMHTADGPSTNATLLTVNKSTLGVTFGTSGKFAVVEGTGNLASADSDADTITMHGDGNTGASALSPNSSHAGYYMGSPAVPDRARVRVDNATSTLKVETDIAAGNIKFNTGENSFAMGITNAGVVGIGVSTPNANSILHVQQASSGATADTSYDDFIYEGSGTIGMSILSNDAGTASLVLGTVTSPTGFRATYDETTGLGQVGTNKANADMKLNYGAGLNGIHLDGTDNFCGIFNATPEGVFHVGDSVATQYATMVSGGNYDLVVVNSSGNMYQYLEGSGGAYIDLFSNSGSVNQRGFRLGTTLSGGFQINAVNDAGVNTYQYMLFDPTNGKIKLPQFAGGGEQDIKVDNDGYLIVA